MRINRGVMGSAEPPAINIWSDNGIRMATLRRGIVHDYHDVVEGDPIDFWRWDELELATDKTVDELSEGLTVIWYEAERMLMEEMAWRADVDAALLEIMEAVV